MSTPRVTQKRVDDALREMGPSYLQSRFRAEWTPKNPTRNFCYVVAEFVYWYVAPKGSTSWQLQVPGDTETHRFVKDPKGKIIDFSANQFPFELDYSNAKPKAFMQSGGRGPSKRARKLATMLGFEEASWDR